MSRLRTMSVSVITTMMKALRSTISRSNRRMVMRLRPEERAKEG